MKAVTKRRFIYLIIAAVLLIAEFLIGKYAKGFIRGSLGDVFVVILVFAVIRIVFLKKPKHLWLYVFVFAVIVEVLQYFSFFGLIPADNSVLSIALGGTFSCGDIACYAAGALICLLLDKIIRRVS